MRRKGMEAVNLSTLFSAATTEILPGEILHIELACDLDEETEPVN